MWQQVQLRALQYRAIDIEVRANRAFIELSEVDTRHAPARKLPVEYQQGGAGTAVSDEHILGGKVPVYEGPRHYSAGFLNLAPMRFSRFQKCDGLVKHLGILGHHGRVVAKMIDQNDLGTAQRSKVVAGFAARQAVLKVKGKTGDLHFAQPAACQRAMVRELRFYEPLLAKALEILKVGLA